MGINAEATLNRRFIEMAKLLNIYLNHFPKHEKYALASRIRDTAYEMYDYITESQKRYHKSSSMFFKRVLCAPAKLLDSLLNFSIVKPKRLAPPSDGITFAFILNHFSNWRTDRFFWGPSEYLYATSYNKTRNPCFARPHRKGFSFAKSRDNKIVFRVICLLFSRSPLAVFRTISLAVFYSFNRMLTRWPRPHVFVKRRKGFYPSFADTHADRPISFIRCAVRIVAPLFHAIPEIIFRRLPEPMELSFFLNQAPPPQGYNNKLFHTIYQLRSKHHDY